MPEGWAVGRLSYGVVDGVGGDDPLAEREHVRIGLVDGHLHPVWSGVPKVSTRVKFSMRWPLTEPTRGLFTR